MLDKNLPEIAGILIPHGMNYTSIRTICFDLYMLLVKLLQEKGKYTDLAVEMLEQ